MELTPTKISPFQNRKKESRNKRTVQKKLRVSGSSYETAKGKQKPGKKAPLNIVTCKCKFECAQIAASSMKTNLFELFYKLDDNEQRNYLMNLLQILPVKRRRHAHYENVVASRRQCSIAFTVPDGQGAFVRVCKKTFMDIFAITTQKIATLVAKKKKVVRQPSMINAVVSESIQQNILFLNES